MNGEITKEAVMLVVRAGKMTGREFHHAIEKGFAEIRADARAKKNVKKAEKIRSKAIEKANAPGSVSMKELMKNGEEIVSTELHDDEIKKVRTRTEKERCSIQRQNGQGNESANLLHFLQG